MSTAPTMQFADRASPRHTVGGYRISDGENSTGEMGGFLTSTALLGFSRKYGLQVHYCNIRFQSDKNSDCAERSRGACPGTADTAGRRDDSHSRRGEKGD